jgi:hypothetical protein
VDVRIQSLVTGGQENKVSPLESGESVINVIEWSLNKNVLIKCKRDYCTFMQAKTCETFNQICFKVDK